MSQEKAYKPEDIYGPRRLQKQARIETYMRPKATTNNFEWEPWARGED